MNSATVSMRPALHRILACIGRLLVYLGGSTQYNDTITGTNFLSYNNSCKHVNDRHVLGIDCTRLQHRDLTIHFTEILLNLFARTRSLKWLVLLFELAQTVFLTSNISWKFHTNQVITDAFIHSHQHKDRVLLRTTFLGSGKYKIDISTENINKICFKMTILSPTLGIGGESKTRGNYRT